MGRPKGSKNKKGTALAISRIGEVWREQTIIGVGGKGGKGTQLFIVEDTMGRVKTKTYSNFKNNHSCGDSGEYLKLRPYESIYNKMVRSAKHRKIEVTLTYEEFALWPLSNARCHYSDRPIDWASSTTYANGILVSQAYNIDRLNPEKGYTLENCVPCLSEHNYAKGRMTEQEYFNKINNK
jgi:hypothetical protein